jgi:hypothetical protein
MAIAVIRVKRVALIVEGPVEPDLVVYDESGMASRRAIRVIISIATHINDVALSLRKSDLQRAAAVQP